MRVEGEEIVWDVKVEVGKGEFVYVMGKVGRGKCSVVKRM